MTEDKVNLTEGCKWLKLFHKVVMMKLNKLVSTMSQKMCAMAARQIYNALAVDV